ncbi:MAG: Acetyltransferase protein [Frankiales bacterium]|nr:Acetyltransferase protein [Frankiales bacterium]
MLLTPELLPREVPSGPSAEPDSAWRRIFNRPQFHQLNQRDGHTPLYLQGHDAAGRLIGGLAGIRHRDGEREMFTSGYSAPFGGFDLVDEHETAENITLLIQDVLRQLEFLGVGDVELKLPPSCYSANEAMIQFTLLNAGFSATRCELNQHLPVADWATIEDYQAQLRPAAQKTLKHLLAEDLRFRELSTEAEWDAAHALLAANRARKGRRLALSADYVATARRELSPDVRMFQLTHHDVHGSGDALAVAAALVYRVGPGRDLVVAWGDGEHRLKRSPMLLLAYRLVENAIAEGVRLLDLGISSEPVGEDGGQEPNFGLTQFKRSTLARIEPRFTLTRTSTRTATGTATRTADRTAR